MSPVMRPCAERDCPNLTERHRCELHEREFQQGRKKRGLTGRRGSTSAWRKLRASILRRDGFACVVCGVTKEQLEEAEDPPLEVDHIDGDPENNERWNLVTLCSECHHNKHRRKAEEEAADDR